jgi:hypothetical protein
LSNRFSFPCSLSGGVSGQVCDDRPVG